MNQKCSLTWVIPLKDFDADLFSLTKKLNRELREPPKNVFNVQNKYGSSNYSRNFSPEPMELENISQFVSAPNVF